MQGVQVYFIDLFDNDAATVAAMKQAGLVPVCYFRCVLHYCTMMAAPTVPSQTPNCATNPKPKFATTAKCGMRDSPAVLLHLSADSLQPGW